MTLVKKAAFAIAVLGLAACGTMSNMMGGTRVNLTGAEEVPPVSTSAKGDGRFTIGSDGSVISYKPI